MLPSIYTPTRITANTVTCIDNILTNNENIIQTTILVNDTSDHMPTILSTNLDFINQKMHENKFIYKRNHFVDNINKFLKRLSEVKWQEILYNNDANDDDHITYLLNNLIRYMMNAFNSIQFNSIQFNSIHFPSKQQTHLKTHKMEEMQLKAKA